MSPGFWDANLENVLGFTLHDDLLPCYYFPNVYRLHVYSFLLVPQVGPIRVLENGIIIKDYILRYGVPDPFRTLFHCEDFPAVDFALPLCFGYFVTMYSMCFHGILLLEILSCLYCVPRSNLTHRLIYG